MAEIENTMDLLTKIVVDSRNDGYTFEEIAEREGISVEEVVRAWKEYVDNRMVMSQEEQWVLHLLRLEKLLVRVNQRLNGASEAEDFELVMKLLDRLEALQGLNVARKEAADSALVELTRAQTQIILTAMVSLQNSFKAQLAEAFEKHKTIKAIKGEVLDNFDSTFLVLAQDALTSTEEQAA
jgi:hypothetical protein